MDKRALQYQLRSSQHGSKHSQMLGGVPGPQMRGRRKTVCEEYVERVKEKSDDLKKFIAHVGLYVGLIGFTAFGALVSVGSMTTSVLFQVLGAISSIFFLQMFWLLEHPHEKQRMLSFQKQVLSEREQFVHNVFNMTSTLSNRELHDVKIYLLNNRNGYEDNGDQGNTFRLSR